MAGRPLRGRDRPCYGYTARIGDREVIESAILNPVPVAVILPRPQALRKGASLPEPEPGETQAGTGGPDAHACHCASPVPGRGTLRQDWAEIRGSTEPPEPWIVKEVGPVSVPAWFKVFT